MSHEIRTPLTAILGYSDMLRDPNQTREDMEHEIQAIIRAGSHLQQIINDILDLSKIEAGQLVIENIDIHTAGLIQDVESIFGARAREKGLNFQVQYDFPLPRHLVSDPTRLNQIFFNLCGNALKFTDQGGVAMTVSYLGATRQLKFQVIDTGIGMSEEELSQLFKPFSQADSSVTRKYGGTGLGLCIARQLVQKLGGDITVSSEKGKGSVFSFTISVGDIVPVLVNGLADLRVVATEETSRLASAGLCGNVLLAQHRPDNQELAKYLIKAGATVEVVDNGLIAVQQALTHSYDLLLMDVQTPLMEGLAATRKLREEGFRGPIVMVMPNATKEDRDRCFNAGADDYLTKPLDVRHLHQLLQRYLKPAAAGRRNVA